jgi:hypothetical protein
MSITSISCPYCQTAVSVGGDAARCGKCNAEIEVFSSIDAARATAEYRENARVSPLPESNLWVVAVA